MSNATDTLARQRLLRLLDEKSFMEIGALVTARSTDFHLDQTSTPGDGVITGYGQIDGTLVYVYSQDASVLNGSIGEMHSKKIKAIYDMAMKMGAPVIGLIDCAGVRLKESFDALEALGKIFAKQTEASGVVPQICAVFGSCGGGLSVLPALGDFTYLEKDAKLFVNSPDAISGNSKGKCDTSCADFQSANNGIVDGVGTEEEIFAQIRSLIGMLPENAFEGGCEDECADDLNRSCDGIEGFAGDVRMLLTMIADGGQFMETKKQFAPDMVTGFLKMNGYTVGAIANCTEHLSEDGSKAEEFESVLTVNGCTKAADFVNFCDAFDIPILSLTNASGLKACLCSEKGLARALARMTRALSEATVPKVNVITKEAMGSAYIFMNSKSIGADLVFAWDGAKAGIMDPKLAASILYEEGGADVIAEKAKEFASVQSGVNRAAERGYVDRIIAPADTRKYMIAAFDMLYTKSVAEPEKKHSTK